MATSFNLDPAVVLLERDEGIAIVTVNRPAAMNALSGDVITELGRAFRQIADDESVHGAILTGAGNRAFIAGADISEIAGADALDAEARARARAGQDVFSLIEELGKPVIAAVNGVAFGGGCEAAMACTLRIAVPSARFGQPEVKLGLIPGFGGTQRMPRLIGKGRALHLILTGDAIGADQALDYGLVDEIAEPAELLVRAKAILASIAANAPLAVRFAMAAVNRGLEAPLASGLAMERHLFALCAETADKAEGTAAFLEKRQPCFHGR